MATAYIYQGFGDYEQKEGVSGITLHYAGVPFFLPFQQVTAIPNWTFREVDHDKSTPQSGQVAVLTYQNTIINGEFIANHFCEKGDPVPGKDMGIVTIKGKPTGKSVVVPAGCTADGQPMTAEILEKEATRSEIEQAERAADEYKRRVVAEYLQSKRQRMSGGNGKTYPDAQTRAYMDELNMEDIDDVATHQKSTGGLDYETIKAIVELTRSATEINAETLREAVETVRKAGKAQLSPHAANGRRSLGLAENKKKFEEEEAKAQEEVKA